MKIIENEQNMTSFHVSGLHASTAGKEAGKAAVSGQKAFQMGAPLQGNGIAEKKAQARQKAMKLVMDVFSADQKSASDVEERRTKVRDLRAESEAAYKELENLEAQKKELQEAYGVADDSKEQQDLQLLEKRRQSELKGSGVFLTKEERDRLKEIDAAGLTEYQSRCLDINKEGDRYRETIAKNQIQIRANLAVNRAVKLEKLKHRPMLEAQQAGEEIMAAASAEALGQLYAEGKEHLDEKMQEQEEAAKKRREEEEEKEEQIEAIKEKREQIEEMVEKTREKVQGQEEHNEIPEPDLEEPTYVMLETDAIRDDIQKELQKMLAKMGLTVEDLKGVAVDENL